MKNHDPHPLKEFAMKNYHLRNFATLISYMFSAHLVSAVVYIFFLANAEKKYVDALRFEEIHILLLVIFAAVFVISMPAMLVAHFKNSEKKMNFLNATYDGGDNRVAVITAFKESLTAFAANLTLQLPMIVAFMFIGYRYADASVFETLYICDMGVYIFFKNSIVGGLLIALLWGIIYFLSTAFIICPMWGLGRIRRKGAPSKPEEPEKDVFYRHTFKNQYKIFYVLKVLLISLLISFAVMLVGAVILGAIISLLGNTGRSIFFGLIYAFVFYKVHGHRRDSSYFPQEKKFSFTKEAAAFCREELVHYAIVFGVLAAVCEISLFIPSLPEIVGIIGKNNIVTFICMFFFPFYSVVSVPLLRSVLNIIWALCVVLICAVVKSYRGHRKVSRASKFRR